MNKKDKNTIKYCRKENCKVELICGENWSENNKKEYNNICKKCYSIQKKEYLIRNKVRRTEWLLKNKERIALSKKEYALKNKDKIKKDKRERYLANKSKIKEQVKNNAAKNKKRINEQKKEYYLINKEKIIKSHRVYVKNKRSIDPAFKLRQLVSSHIKYALKNNKKLSTWDNLDYTPAELKNHLESLFEPWMTWNNHGIYNKKLWADDDQKTWTWHIDHIVPHSKFNYTSMESSSFKECWKLSNLRPLSSKINVLQGSRRDINSVFRIKSLMFFRKNKNKY